MIVGGEPVATGATSSSGSIQRILVLGVYHPRDIAAIRSFGRMGIPVDVADRWKSSTWVGCRYIRDRYLIHPDDDEALSDVVALGERGGGLLLPSNDDYLIGKGRISAPDCPLRVRPNRPRLSRVSGGMLGKVHRSPIASSSSRGGGNRRISVFGT